jgi:hypothetical protein
VKPNEKTREIGIGVRDAGSWMKQQRTEENIQKT